MLDVPRALPIGALTFLPGYLPLVGATTAGAVAVAVAVAGVTDGWATALWALLVVIVVQQIEGNVLAPLLLFRTITAVASASALVNGHRLLSRPGPAGRQDVGTPSERGMSPRNPGSDGDPLLD